jgi:tRNA G46 methylase TrmB
MLLQSWTWLEKVSRSLPLQLPSSSADYSLDWYRAVRPHHVICLYAAYCTTLALVPSSSSSSGSKHGVVGMYQRLAAAVLREASRCTERCIPLIYTGLIPDWCIRFGIRLQLRDHLQILRNKKSFKSTSSSSSQAAVEMELQTKMEIVQQLGESPIAIATESANQQHYEVPARFYDLCLGTRKKYSSGWWTRPNTTLEESEVAMLELYCQRAELENGMSIVDLGCGWGSLTLFLAERYPDCTITAISNSHSQRDYILATAAERGLFNAEKNNINVITVCVCLLCSFFLLVWRFVSHLIWLIVIPFTFPPPVQRRQRPGRIGCRQEP